MITLILSLGMDTLMVSVSLGMLQVKGRVKIAVTFAFAEALMPLVGLVVGRLLGQAIGNWAALIGAVALMALGAWLLFFESEDDEGERLQRNLTGWTLLLTALSISVDELAVGFSIGLIGIPVGLTIVLIALQAFVFTSLGITFGSKFKRFLGEWAEKLAGILLALLGLWILGEAVIHVLR